MNRVAHTTLSIDATGAVERREGELPAAVASVLAPVRATVTADVDRHTAARLLRALADEIERDEAGDA